MTLLISLAILFFLLFIGFNYLYKRTNYYKNQFIALSDYKSNMPNNIKLAIFGSTYAKFAFNSLKEFDHNAMNFALDAECLECDQAIIEQYNHKLAPGCIVIFTIGACAACSKKEDIVCINPRYYYQILDYKRIPINILSIKNFLKFYFPLAFKPQGIKYIFFDCKKFDNIIDTYPYECETEKRKTSMQSLVDVWLKMFKLPNLKDANLSEDIQNRVEINIEVLKQLVQYAINNGFRPVIVVPPMSRLLNSYYSDSFIDKTLKRLCLSVKSEFNIPYLDYRTHIDFQLDETMFLDGGFRMSSIGSSHFVKIVLKDLCKYGYKLNNNYIQK